MLLAIVLASGAGCDLLLDPLPRTLDARPRIRTLDPPLPPGRAEAYFAFETGGDQLSIRDVEVGLSLVVRSLATERRLTFESCDEARSSQVMDGPENVLYVVRCDGRRYWLLSESGEVLATRADGSAAGEIAARIAIEPGVYAVWLGEASR